MDNKQLQMIQELKEFLEKHDAAFELEKQYEDFPGGSTWYSLVLRYGREGKLHLSTQGGSTSAKHLTSLLRTL